MSLSRSLVAKTTASLRIDDFYLKRPWIMVDGGGLSLRVETVFVACGTGTPCRVRRVSDGGRSAGGGARQKMDGVRKCIMSVGSCGIHHSQSFNSMVS